MSEGMVAQWRQDNFITGLRSFLVGDARRKMYVGCGSEHSRKATAMLQIHSHGQAAEVEWAEAKVWVCDLPEGMERAERQGWWVELQRLRRGGEE
jgi:hypothetical protein